MSGHRVRVLLEWYDPHSDAQEAESFARGVASGLERLYPGAVVAKYVEANPPPDEVT